MVQAIKMAARVLALVAIGGAMVVLFAAVANMIAGAIGIGSIIPYIRIAVTFINHWTGGVGNWLIGIGGTLFAIEAGILVFKGVLLAQKFILKVSEG